MINTVVINKDMVHIFFCLLIVGFVFFINKVIKDKVELYANYKYNFIANIFNITFILSYYVLQDTIVVLIFAGVFFVFGL